MSHLSDELTVDVSVCFRYITVWASRHRQDTAGQGCGYTMLFEFPQVYIYVVLKRTQSNVTELN